MVGNNNNSVEEKRRGWLLSLYFATSVPALGARAMNPRPNGGRSPVLKTSP